MSDFVMRGLPGLVQERSLYYIFGTVNGDDHKPVPTAAIYGLRTLEPSLESIRDAAQSLATASELSIHTRITPGTPRVLYVAGSVDELLETAIERTDIITQPADATMLKMRHRELREALASIPGYQGNMTAEHLERLTLDPFGG